jgi:polar amino acid transport system substrate-binding protein
MWRAALLLALLFTAGRASAQATPVLLAAEDDWPPYTAAETPGLATQRPPVGFSVDLIRAAFARQGLAVEFVVVPFARCLLLAKTAQVAGCFNTTQTDDNRAEYHWHQPPMFEEELSIFGRAADARNGAAELRLADLRGQRVGFTNGYTYPSEFMHDARIQRFSANSDAALLRMLAGGRVDYALINRIDAVPELRGKLLRRGRISLDGFWIAFSKQHPQGQALAEGFGRSLEQMRRDGSYQRMLDAFRQQVGYR